MLRQAHTPLRRFLPFVLLLTGILVLPSLGGAGTAPSQSALRARDAHIIAQSRSAVLSLYSLDQRLAAARARLSALQVEAGDLRRQRTELRRERALARANTHVAARRLGARLRLLYEQGDVEPLEILFGSRNLDDALSEIDALSRTGDQGKSELLELDAARAHLRAASSTLGQRTAALHAAIAAAAATARSLEETRAARSAYVDSLAATRRLTEQQLGSLVARAHAAAVHSASLTMATYARFTSVADVTSPEHAPPPSTSGSLTVVATGYALGGSTATGLPVGWGVAAVDPSVIPLGTHFEVPGYGEAVAADTGGSIRGARIDLWFPSVAQADSWGLRTVTITLH